MRKNQKPSGHIYIKCQLRKIGLWIWAGIMIAVLFVPVQAKPVRIVRVAYPIQSGLTEIDENGKYSGYTYEYLQEIAQYTGWNYEFITPEDDLDSSLERMMDQVASGEIDLMGGMLYSEEMLESYDYSAYSYGTVETVLAALDDDPRDLVIDSRLPQTLRIAIHHNAETRKKELLEYCDMNLIVPEFIPCENEELMLAALRSGAADVVLITSAQHIENIRTIARFAPKPYYFIASKTDTTGLMGELNYALQSIDQTDPTFANRLNEKYFGDSTAQFTLSEKEQMYVKNHPIVNVGYLTNYPPFQYGEQTPAGISIDFLNNIETQSGLDFNWIGAESLAELDQLAAEGKIQMVAGMTYNYESAQQRNLSMSRVYLTSQYIMMLNEKISEQELTGRRVAVSEYNQYTPSLGSPEITYPTTEECIRSVNSGQTDYTYTDALVAQYYINQGKFDRLRTIAISSGIHEVCFGVVKGGGGELLTILNKAILTTPSEDIQGLIYQNTIYHHKTTLFQFIRDNPLEMILIVTSISAGIITILSYFFVQRSRLNQRLELELNKHLQVYQIVDDYFFEYDLGTQMLQLYEPSASGELRNNLRMVDMKQIRTKGEGQAFLTLLESEEDQVSELCIRTAQEPNLKPHWYRIAIRTVSDTAGLPICRIGRITNIDHEIDEKEQLREKARQDSLTKTLNAEAIRNQTCEVLQQLDDGRHAAVVLIDVDNFKAVNDTFGHLIGDQALIAVAELLSRQFPEGIVGRPGGDEFMVCLSPSANRKILEKRFTSLKEDVRNLCISQELRLTISIGIAVVSCGIDYEQAYAAADEALYQAKDQGRDYVVIKEL